MKYFTLRRGIYAGLFLLFLAVEVLIALFVRDAFLRPYVGDVLVVVVICLFVRIFFPHRPRLLPLYVFFFSAAVEIGQYFDYVTLLGLDQIRFFRILLGTTFSVEDLLCYGVGAVLFFLGELLTELFLRRRKLRASSEA